MIIETGIVRITALKLEAANFQFNFDGNVTDASATNEVIDWAIKRLEAERITVQPEQQSNE